eukprot:m.479748 g.479748  ORF g.479748 m.479748 type:complete len:55 (-) comp50495_c0_seq1:189-353(-)
MIKGLTTYQLKCRHTVQPPTITGRRALAAAIAVAAETGEAAGGRHSAARRRAEC